jgi:hypothetical protein
MLFSLQVAFIDLLVHTLDNVPPDTLSLDVANITGSSGQLQLTLNEPSTAYFIVLPHGPSGPGACPAAEQVCTATYWLSYEAYSYVYITRFDCLGSIQQLH